MPLSEREQRILEQLERELSSEDPKLATTMKEGPRASFSRVALAMVGIVVGLLLLIIGVSQSQPVIGVIGFVVMAGVVIFAATPSKRSKTQAAKQTPLFGNPPAKKQVKKQSFTERMEQRWEDRSNGS